MKDLPLYILTVFLLGVSVYLHSPLTAVGVVVLWGFKYAETVLTRKNLDADLLEMRAAYATLTAKVALIDRHMAAMADRAKTILGDY